MVAVTKRFHNFLCDFHERPPAVFFDWPGGVSHFISLARPTRVPSSFSRPTAKISAQSNSGTACSSDGTASLLERASTILTSHPAETHLSIQDMELLEKIEALRGAKSALLSKNISVSAPP
jgi:hypothetical protein